MISISLSYTGVFNRAPLQANQLTKATVTSATLERAPFQRWLRDFGYRKSEIYPLQLDALGCPAIDVDVSGTRLSLAFDTGTSRGFLITTHAPSVPHSIEASNEELNADGSHRGNSYLIRVESITVLGRVFKNIAGSLSDWQMYSSEPFNGTVGLDFFLDRRVTLDYISRKVAVTTAPLVKRLDSKHYLSVDLVEPPKSQGHILYVRAKVNGRDAIIYLDTGYNVSFIDPAFTQGLARVERAGKFRVFRERVPMELGGQSFLFDELRESEIRRGTGFDLPVALTLGSDVLSHFVVTIDIRALRLILALADDGVKK